MRFKLVRVIELAIRVFILTHCILQPLDELWIVLLICIIRNGPWALRENNALAASQSERAFYRLQTPAI